MTQKRQCTCGRNQPSPLSELPFDDEPAQRPIPDDVAHALSTRQLDVFLGDRRATPEELCTALRGQSDLVLPTNFTPAPVTDPAVDITAGNDNHHRTEDLEPLNSYQPPWAETVFRPKPPLVPAVQNLRAANGSLVRPLVDERIFGRDDRHWFVPNGFPWHCIGKLSIFDEHGQDAGGGTATLVGRRTIVTAAHVMPTGVASWTARFVAARFGGTRRSNRSVLAAGAASWITNARGYFNHDVGNDMMIMRLSEPLGDWLGYLGVTTYDDDWEDMPRWTHVGYPNALSPFFFLAGGAFPYRQEQIAVYDDDDGPNDSLELQHYGDAGRGDSGGPLLGWFGIPPLTPTTVSIVGVMSGNYTRSGGIFGIGDYDHNVHAGGNALVRLCRYGRDNWD